MQQEVLALKIVISLLPCHLNFSFLGTKYSIQNTFPLKIEIF